MNENVKLIEKYVYEENDLLYLYLAYEITDKNRKRILYLPKIATGFSTKIKPMVNEVVLGHHSPTITPPNSSNEYLLMNSRFNKNIPTIEGMRYVDEIIYYLITTVEEYPLEVTISEIEKKFGYKVKIINEEKGGNE